MFLSVRYENTALIMAETCVKSTECFNITFYTFIISAKNRHTVERFIHETTEWVLIELTLALYTTSWSSGLTVAQNGRIQFLFYKAEIKPYHICQKKHHI